MILSRSAFLAMIFFLLCGCSRPAPLTPGTFAMCIAANEADHLEIIALAQETPGEIVLKDGEIVGEWLQVATNSLASQQIDETDDFIVREVNGGKEVLVVHSQFDLTEKYIRTATLSEEADIDGRPYVEIISNSDGARITRLLTRSNLPDYTNELYRNVAMVVRGQVFELPRLEYEVGSRFVISTTSPEHAAYIVAILNGKVQQPPQ
ncbi:SecDF P1 head subdomain-containing protein [Symmachiella dynata]|uniref:SecDF P1 head subdomain-containing protein n=1 Tax=Symmachiella dynata TaxID=2527995 RepID=UPI0030EEB0A4